MKTLWVWLFSALMTLATLNVAHADVLQLKEDYPERYVVQKGDTLWDISGRFLKNPWEWPEIWNYNQQIKNPHLIFPGDVLTLVWVNGRPQIQVNRGKTSETIKLSPYVRKTPIDSAITTIPLEAIRPFLESAEFVDKDTLKTSAYIVAAADDRVLMGKGSKIYGRGEFLEGVKEYGVYRVGKKYKHPRTKEKLGTQVKKIGEARLMSLDGEFANLMTEEATTGLLKGDILLPMQDGSLQAFFQPRPVVKPVEASIMEVVGGVFNAGKLDVVMLDIGKNDDIDAGSVFGVYKDGIRVVDPKTNRRVTLPAELGGNLMVFRSFDSVSYALILSAAVPLNVGDALGRP